MKINEICCACQQNIIKYSFEVDFCRLESDNWVTCLYTQSYCAECFTHIYGSFPAVQNAGKCLDCEKSITNLHSVNHFIGFYEFNDETIHYRFRLCKECFEIRGGIFPIY